MSKKLIIGSAVILSLIVATSTYFITDGINDRNIFLYSNASDPDLDGKFTLFWTDINIDNYTIYQSSNYITEINDSLSLINKQIENKLELSYDSGTYYFIIEGKNSISNCISVIIEQQELYLFTNEPISEDEEFILQWTELENITNYIIYQSNKYISNINEDLTVVNQTNKNFCNILNHIDGTFYFAIQANNEFRYILSNCLEIKIQKIPITFNLTDDTVNGIDIDGYFNIIWEISSNSDDYTIYQHNNFITEINETIINLGNTNETNFYFILYPEGTYYFRVRANNEYGNILSNCIKIIVQF